MLRFEPGGKTQAVVERGMLLGVDGDFVEAGQARPLAQEAFGQRPAIRVRQHAVDLGTEHVRVVEPAFGGIASSSSSGIRLQRKYDSRLANSIWLRVSPALSSSR